MVQSDELQRTKKKQTYLISPISREKEDYQRRLFFTDKEKFHHSYLDSNKTEYRWYNLMNYKERKNRHILYHLHLKK